MQYINSKINSSPKIAIVLVVIVNPDHNGKLSGLQHDFSNPNQQRNSVFILLIVCRIILKNTHSSQSYCIVIFLLYPCRISLKAQTLELQLSAVLQQKANSDNKTSFLILSTEIRDSKGLTTFLKFRSLICRNDNNISICLYHKDNLRIKSNEIIEVKVLG